RVEIPGPITILYRLQRTCRLGGVVGPTSFLPSFRVLPAFRNRERRSFRIERDGIEIRSSCRPVKLCRREVTMLRTSDTSRQPYGDRVDGPCSIRLEAPTLSADARCGDVLSRHASRAGPCLAVPGDRRR